MSVGGLRAMARQYVHLTTDRVMAVRTGRRKTLVPQVLVIDAVVTHRAGVLFYPSSDLVWLAEDVPIAFIEGLRP